MGLSQIRFVSSCYFSETHSSDSAMNIDFPGDYSHLSTSSAQYSSNDRVTISAGPDHMSQIFPSSWQGIDSLSDVPQYKLREYLHPILQALEKLDAEHLLGLQRTSHGPQVREG